MSAPRQISDLVDRFAEHADAYRSGAYNETQVRREFVDPMFKALGWDMDNLSGYAEAYKDVIHEDAIKIGGATKAPDYCFRIGGTRKFFLEAKKPSVDIKSDAHPAFQLRRYAWSAKLPLSILTDFEEFAVYDCRIEPTLKDKASVARVLYLGCREYADRWDDIAKVFSREAILKGSFDKFAESNKAKRGTAQVDDAFLYEIEKWRADLARNLATRNPQLTQRDLNFSVQRTIDRIVFLRICEDRRIEVYGRLQALLNGEHTYDRMRELFRLADERYNSGLFHFQKEKNRIEPPDDLTPGLEIDDDVLKKIIKRLYYPYSPYEFSVLPADILGQVYEQFLGKVIRLTEGHQAKVEDKPEVKKAGGVYYTPTYIVDYIVKNTVGKLLEKKARKQAAKLRILDPACGSGSFLIGAYQYLLDWHRDWYVAHDPKKLAGKAAPVLYQASGGEWKLTTGERKRILLQNIFGVDIDAQAVETTKLSLLLKVLEGESEQSLATQLRFFHTRALPDLGSNIKCGNSLIGPDFYEQSELLFLDEDERYRINVFDWSGKDGFPEIMKAGGFDAVIGNPPYLNIDDTWGRGDPRQRYIKRTYADVYNDKTDILFYFLRKAVQISKREVAFIVSRAFLEAYKADKLRGWLASHAEVCEIIDFRNHYVFKRVGITTCIVHLAKGKKNPNATIHRLHGNYSNGVHPLSELGNRNIFELISVPQSQFGSAPWTFAAADVEVLNQKIDSKGDPLRRILQVGQGMQTGRNDVFGELDPKLASKWRLGRGNYFLRARNSDIWRYEVRESGEMLLYLEDFQAFDDLPPVVRDHLKEHQKELKERAAYQRQDCEWWKYTWPLHKERAHRHKLLCPYLATHNRFALDTEQKYLGLTDTTILYDADQQEDLKYVMALLNSALLTFRFRSIGKLKSGGILEYFWNSVSKLPIRRITFSNEADKDRHDRIVSLVERMLGLHKQLAAANTEHAKNTIQRQIDETDAQIDRLVYELYGLSDDEIKIVEAV
jgi:type I restriction-modification system DNA methylase subunit